MSWDDGEPWCNKCNACKGESCLGCHKRELEKQKKRAQLWKDLAKYMRYGWIRASLKIDAVEEELKNEKTDERSDKGDDSSPLPRSTEKADFLQSQG